MKKLKHSCFLLIILCISLFSVSVHAHHSSSHFAEEVSEMEGTLVRKIWRNPHVYMFLETEEEDGTKKTWELEAGTLYMIKRAGISSDLFNVGDKVRVAGNKSNTYDNKFWLENLLTPKGEEFIFVARSRPRWNEVAIGGKRQWKDTSTGDKQTSNVGEGVFRVWSPATRGVELSAGLKANRLPSVATEQALADRGDWDYSFDKTCQAPGMPRANHSPHPHQLIDMGDTIHIYSEEFHQTRIIHMNSKVDPETQPYSTLGYSSGRWENENTLVVETSRIDFPFMDLTGVKQSKKVSVEERYVLNDEKSQVEFTVIVKDPVMLKEPHIKRGMWLDLNEVIDKATVCIPREVEESK